MIQRHLSNYLQKIHRSFPIISITGPRQSGKTTLVKSLFPDHAYKNLEALDVRNAAVEDPRKFLTSFEGKGLIIDEAQKVPELFSYLQGIVDERKTIGEYILTGSQNFLLLERISQSLAGRVAVIHLLPFSLFELTATPYGKDSLDHFMFKGFLPPLYDRNIHPSDFYPFYIQTYIERDVRSIRNVEDLSAFSRFISLCAARTGQLLNLSSLGIELGISHKTVKSWLSILESSFIIFLLPPFYKNYNKRITKQPKLYFYDTGLVCSLLGLDDVRQISDHYLRGNIFENFIIAEYVKNRFHIGKRKNISFWRDNTGNEVDLIIEDGPSVHGVEIKSGTAITEDFFKGLKYLHKISGTPDTNLFLVYGGDEQGARRYGRVTGWRNTSTLPGLESGI